MPRRRANGEGSILFSEFSTDGTYRVALPPGKYVVALLGPGMGFSRDLPHEVTIKSDQTVRLDIVIDTGIR
jgi:hypothetical protein